MKKTIIRILSSVLCLAMLFTMLPTTIFAADDTPEKLELSDGYIKLTASGKNGKNRRRRS